VILILYFNKQGVTSELHFRHNFKKSVQRFQKNPRFQDIGWGNDSTTHIYKVTHLFVTEWITHLNASMHFFNKVWKTQHIEFMLCVMCVSVKEFMWSERWRFLYLLLQLCLHHSLTERDSREERWEGAHFGWPWLQHGKVWDAHTHTHTHTHTHSANHREDVYVLIIFHSRFSVGWSRLKNGFQIWWRAAEKQC